MHKRDIGTKFIGQNCTQLPFCKIFFNINSFQMARVLCFPIRLVNIWCEKSHYIYTSIIPIISLAQVLIVDTSWWPKKLFNMYIRHFFPHQTCFLLSSTFWLILLINPMIFGAYKPTLKNTGCVKNRPTLLWFGDVCFFTISVEPLSRIIDYTLITFQFSCLKFGWFYL